MNRERRALESLDQEIRDHIERETQDNINRGLTPQEARRVAVLRFGNVALVKEDTRAVWVVVWLEQLLQDIRFGIRTLRRAPGFTTVVVVTLALGIGATTAIFSVVNGVLLAPLPFRDAERLYQISAVYRDGTPYPMSPPDFMTIREQTRVFEQVEAYDNRAILTLLGEGGSQEVQSARITYGLFDLLGLPVAVGRGFLPEEYQRGREKVAVLDHGFWQRAFGGDRAVLGRTLSWVADVPYTIVGVLAPGAQILGEPDVYTPLRHSSFSAESAEGRNGTYLHVLGRATDAGGAPIQDDLRRIGTQVEAAFPRTNEGVTFAAVALAETILGDVRRPLLVLLGAVGVVLLVACANVANLLLARASARQGELAVRAALGGGRGRLVRQLLTEATVLGLAGGAGGLAIAYWSTQALVAAQPADIPRVEEIGLNGTVLLFALAVTLVTSLVFGTVPALKATGGRLVRALSEDTRGGGGGGHRTRATLVVAEVALAVVLLMGAGLLIRSFVELTRVDFGFQPEQAIAFRLMAVPRAPRTEPVSRADELLARLRTLPGVFSVGATTELPLSGPSSIDTFSVVDAPPPPANVNREIDVALVTPGYFQTIGTPLRSGRFITDRDHADAPPVALINEAAVRRWFPGEDPVGKRVRLEVELEVIGVVADVLQTHPGEPVRPQLFASSAQLHRQSLRFVLRTTGDPSTLAAAVRAEVRALDPDLAVAEFIPLDGLVATSVARPRVYAALMTLFAVVALSLAAAGIFGVTSYTVVRRTREIGIRIALGAHAADVLRMIVGRLLALAAIGGVLGIAAGVGLGRVIQSELFGVPLLDPVALGAAVLVLTATAIAASALPALRATRIDPMRALRHE